VPSARAAGVAGVGKLLLNHQPLLLQFPTLLGGQRLVCDGASAAGGGK
jgi:hypothetical protein